MSANFSCWTDKIVNIIIIIKLKWSLCLPQFFDYRLKKIIWEKKNSTPSINKHVQQIGYTIRTFLSTHTERDKTKAQFQYIQPKSDWIKEFQFLEWNKGWYITTCTIFTWERISIVLGVFACVWFLWIYWVCARVCLYRKQKRRREIKKQFVYI